MTKNVGTALSDAKATGLRWLASALGLIVYLGMVAYAEVRNFTLLSATIDPDLLPLSIVGVVALGLTALSLPLVIHYGSEPGRHRLWAILFYVGDLALMTMNAVLDANLHTAGDLGEPLQIWATWVVPSTPLVVGMGWAILWLLDPSHQERDLMAQVKAATRQALAERVVEAASLADVNQEVEFAAQNMTRQLVAEALGQAIPRRATPRLRANPVEDAGDEEAVPALVASPNGQDPATGKVAGGRS